MRSGPRYKLPTANPSPFRGEGLIEGAGRGCAPVLGIISGFGDNGGGETPVPFPNTEVKPSSADGTAGVTRRESRSSPSIFFLVPSGFGPAGLELFLEPRPPRAPARPRPRRAAWAAAHSSGLQAARAARRGLPAHRARPGRPARGKGRSAALPRPLRAQGWARRRGRGPP